MTKLVAPLAFEAWQDYVFEFISFSCAERRVLANALAGESLNHANKYTDLSAREQEEFKLKIANLQQPRKNFSLTNFEKLPEPPNAQTA